MTAAHPCPHNKCAGPNQAPSTTAFFIAKSNTKSSVVGRAGVWPDFDCAGREAFQPFHSNYYLNPRLGRVAFLSSGGEQSRKGNVWSAPWLTQFGDGLEKALPTPDLFVFFFVTNVGRGRAWFWPVLELCGPVCPPACSIPAVVDYPSRDRRHVQSEGLHRRGDQTAGERPDPHNSSTSQNETLSIAIIFMFLFSIKKTGVREAWCRPEPAYCDSRRFSTNPFPRKKCLPARGLRHVKHEGSTRGWNGTTGALPSS